MLIPKFNSRNEHRNQWLPHHFLEIAFRDLSIVGVFAFAIWVCLLKSKSWGFTPHPTKEDCSSYPPWMLQDAPSEVTCIEYWLRAYSKIANASDGTSCTRKLTRHPCLAHAIVFNALQQLCRGRWTPVVTVLAVNSKRVLHVSSFILCISHLFVLVSTKQDCFRGAG